MSINRQVVVSVAAALGLVAVASIAVFSIGKSNPKCEDTIVDTMQINKSKQMEANLDGGVSIVMQEPTAGLYTFVMLVGPVTAENLHTYLTSKGLAAVQTEQSGKCLGANGFNYSVVKGRYYIPQQQ